MRLAFYRKVGHSIAARLRLRPPPGRCSLRSVLLPCGSSPCCCLGMMLVSRFRTSGTAAAGIFVRGLLSTLGFIPFLYQGSSTVADRYIYLPMLGVSLALAMWLARHWSLAPAAAAVSAGRPGARSAVHGRLARTDLAVFQHGLEVNPRSYAARYSLGGVYRERGQTLAAESYYRAASRLNPSLPAPNDLGADLAIARPHSGSDRGIS